jgi:DNA-binding GntR family transcriptional regulator
LFQLPQSLSDAYTAFSAQPLRFGSRRLRKDVAEKLGIKEKEPVLHFERVRYANDRPLVLEKSWIPAAECPDLKRKDLKGSLYLILFKKYHHHIMAAHQSLRAVVASEVDARILGLQIGEPVMLVRGVTYLYDGRAIEAEESHFRAGSIEFIIELGESSQYARLMPHHCLPRSKSTAMKGAGSEH